MDEMNEKVEELKVVAEDIKDVSEANKIVKNAGGKSKAGLILIGILSVLGVVKIFGIVKNWIKKIRTKRELKKHPERFMTVEDAEKQSEAEPEEEKSLEDISEELRNK
jgi:hypothetical protein